MRRDRDYVVSSIEGHHDDYSEPLNVRWLCQLCHQAWHKKNGRGLNPTAELMSGAYKAVKLAIEEGRLVRPNKCQECGNKRSEHLGGIIANDDITCLECGLEFNPRRSDATYCSGTCRRLAFEQKGIPGRVYRAQVLKSGEVSIVIHTSKATLTAGDRIRWVKD